MLLDLNAMPQGVPAAWAGIVEKSADGWLVRGDRTAATEVFLSQHQGRIIAADRVDELLDHLHSKQAAPPLSSFGLSSLLHPGLGPPPFSEFADIYSLTMGDRAEVSWEGDEPRVELECDYPWFPARSTEDAVPSERTLLDLLTKTTSREVEGSAGQGFLMLSSGKDSAAVALALAEAGYTHIPCVTYSSGVGDPEPAIAAEVCKRLGLKHHIVELPEDPKRVAATLTRFFEASPLPSTDLAQIPYVLATAGAGSTEGVVIDGGGNDAYMGFPVTSRWTAKTRLRFRGRRVVDFAQRHTAVDSPINYLARSRLETALSGRMIRFHESREFMPDAVDTRDFWAQLSQDTAHLSLFDAYAFLERYATPPASMKKHVLAARSIGHEPSVPWCDGDIADYYFNLPEEHRYDRKRGINKVLLRRMLLAFLDYDSDKIGKHYFAFDGARFVAENREYVRSEIDSCVLWDHRKLGQVHEWLDGVESRPLLYHAILTLFMVSGWHNHSRFINAAAVGHHG